MAVYYIEEPFYQTHTAGSKPRNDFNSILKSLGFKSFQERITASNPYLTLEDVVFFQYTFAIFGAQHVYDFCHDHRIRTVLFVNDISTLHDGNYEGIQGEISLLNKASILIVHNEKMREWLINQGVTIPMICLNLFDYLIDETIFNKVPIRNFSKEVIFAGNLNPSLRKFLYDPSFKHEYELNLYGPEVNGKFGSEHTTYYGSFTPEQIPAQLKGSFGLHWNGEHQDTCSGRVGYYSTLATAHKISLYLVSKLPIICWEHSSEAEFITKENLGITISSLDEIDVKLSQLDVCQYNEMVENAVKYSIKLQQGYHFKKVIHDAIDALNVNI